MKTILYGNTGTVNVQRLQDEIEKENRTVFTIHINASSSFDALKSGLQELRTSEVEYTDLIIDSYDKLEPLIFKKIVHDTSNSSGVKVESIEHVDGGYQKGYVRSREMLSSVLSWIDVSIVQKMNIKVWIISGADMVEFKNPFGIIYNKFTLRCNKVLSPALESWADNIYFVAEPGLFDPASASDHTDVFVKPSLAYLSKNSNGDKFKTNKVLLSDIV